MTIAFRFSAASGLCTAEDAERAAAVFRAVGLPTALENLGRDFSADRILDRMRQDKKADGGLVLILAEAVGRAIRVPDVDPDSVRAFLLDEGAR